MPLKIFKRTKKSPSSSNKESPSEQLLSSFLIDIEKLKKILSDFYPIDREEWIATNTVSIYKNITHLNFVISTYCTDESCPNLIINSCPIVWNEEKSKRVSTTAPEYIGFALVTIESCIISEDIFPSKYGKSFSPSFVPQLKRVFKLIGHVLCHYYSNHFEHFVNCNLYQHLNTVTFQFLWFCENESLVDIKDLETIEAMAKKWGFFIKQST